MYFYDEYGSKLFNRITELEEYYPTRTEKKIFTEQGADIAGAVGARSAVLEYGSGSSEKIEWLVRGLKDPVAYVAMDISKDHLLASAKALTDALPVPVAAICADFHTPLELPREALDEAAQWLGFFPGSTLGNMTPEEATAFMNGASGALGANAQFLLGVDLEKDKAVLEAAYDDAAGVTAAFNLNVLTRMKRELDAEIRIDDFEHAAFYNEAQSRIEMHLRAVRETRIRIDEREFFFNQGETLHTENSYKYTLDRLKSLIEPTPWRLETVWTDPNEWFAACLLSNS